MFPVLSASGGAPGKIKEYAFTKHWTILNSNHKSTYNLQ